jgi:flagellar hook-associated protein 2
MATSGVGGASLDVNAIVTQLMSLERRPLEALSRREAQVTARMAAVARVQGAVSGLQVAAASLAKSATFSGLRASVGGDAATVAVTDGSKAAAGSYTLKVNALASAQSLASQAFTAGASIGTGTLRLELGSVAGGVFTPRAGTTFPTLTIDAGNNTLAGIRDAINAARIGVTAGIVNDGSGARLTVTANDTGLASVLRITVDGDGDGDNGDNAGLSRLSFDPTIALPPEQTVTAGRQLQQTRAAADAAFEVNGLALSASSNRVTGAIEGLSLDLRKLSADAVTVTVERDTAAIRGAVDGFVKAYNDLDRLIRDLTAFDPATRRGATLNGDAAVRSLQTQVRGLVRAQLNVAEGELASRSAAGIEAGRDGTLSVNAARFDAAVADPARLARLFTATSTIESQQGLGVRLEALAKSLTGTDGLLPARTKGLQAQVDSINRQEGQFNNRLVEIERRLRRQYAALDTQLQRMQGTSNSLANALSGLPKPPGA